MQEAIERTFNPEVLGVIAVVGVLVAILAGPPRVLRQVTKGSPFATWGHLATWALFFTIMVATRVLSDWVRAALHSRP